MIVRIFIEKLSVLCSYLYADLQQQ